MYNIKYVITAAIKHVITAAIYTIIHIYEENRVRNSWGISHIYYYHQRYRGGAKERRRDDCRGGTLPIHRPFIFLDSFHSRLWMHVTSGKDQQRTLELQRFVRWQLIPGRCNFQVNGYSWLTTWLCFILITLSSHPSVSPEVHRVSVCSRLLLVLWSDTTRWDSSVGGLTLRIPETHKRHKKQRHSRWWESCHLHTKR